MYAKKYSFWDEKQFPGFKQFLNHLFEESKKEYFRDLKSSRSYYSNREFLMIASFINDLEHYYASLFSLGLINKDNHSNVLKQLKSIRSVKIMPKSMRNCFGLTIDKDVFVNPDISDNEFSKEDMRSLVVSHEASHIINQGNKKDIETFCSFLYENSHVRELLDSIGLDSKKYLEQGFSLLDEVVSEDVGERVLYRKVGRERPEVTTRCDKKVFGYQPYQSNFLYYGELQEMAVKFSKKMNFINSGDSIDENLKRLAIASFSKDFILKVQDEFYRDKDSFDSFVIMLACMGKVHEATYKIIGLDHSLDEVDVHSYLDIFRNYSDGVENKVLEKNKN